MAKLATRYFGEIDLDRLEEWYDTEIELHKNTVEISITVSTKVKVDTANIQAVDDFIDELKSDERHIRQIIYHDFKKGGETKTYIDLQVDGLEKEDIADLIEGADKSLNDKEKLLSVLHLLRIIFYPEQEDNTFAVLDYTIDKELTDDLLVFVINKDNSSKITIES
jgi:hypothetical protein